MKTIRIISHQMGESFPDYPLQAGTNPITHQIHRNMEQTELEKLIKFLNSFEDSCKNGKSYPIMQTDIDYLTDLINAVIEERERIACKKLQASELTMTCSIGRISTAEYEKYNNYEYLLWIDDDSFYRSYLNCRIRKI